MQCFLLPGKALGPFRLGSTLRECISELQFNSRDFKRVNTTFNIEDETKDDIILDIRTCGIFLRFDSIEQRLKLIDVYDLTKISIYYHKQLLTAPPTISPSSSSSDTKEKEEKQDSNSNTFARIYNIMGLTHPGFYDCKRQLYYVEYEGLWLSFILNYDPGPSSLPVDLNDGSSPILSRLIVFYGKNGFLSHQLPPKGETLSQIHSNINNIKSTTSIHLYSYYFEPIYVTLNCGIRLIWRNRRILFGCSVQDVLSDIGAPYTVYYKQNNDYFFNYIDLGLDILFNGNSHTITKFVLHTNCVGHPDFNRWCKCNFSIILFNDIECAITSSSKWSDILQYLGPNTGPPIMYRSSHGKIENVNHGEKEKENEDNDESIKIYAFQSVLFEIMANGSISTVTLFKERNYNSPKYKPMNMNMTRTQSLVFDEPDRIEPLPSTHHHHHSRINPSPLSKSIGEATKSQLQFVETKENKKLKQKRIKKKKRIKQKRSNELQPGAVEIDHIITNNDDNQHTNANTVSKDKDHDQNEMFDNVKL